MLWYVLAKQPPDLAAASAPGMPSATLPLHVICRSTQQAFQSAADSLLVPDMPGGAARPHTHYTACCCVRSRAEDLLSRSAFPEVMWIIQTWPAGHHVVLDVARRELYCATCREHKVDAAFDCHLLVSTLRELCWIGWAESPLVGATWQGSQCSLRLSA